MPDAVIVVKDLWKVYGTTEAVRGVSFTVKKGEVFSLVGPNGAGKTTTVEILECLRLPTKGTARVLGLDVVKQDAEVKKRIGVMPQEFNAFERLTVEENVGLIAGIYRSEENVRHVLEEMSLWDVRRKRFVSLSGGMKRRVGIAMALVSDPEVLMLDEPTTGLDPHARREVWDVISYLRSSGKTVLLTTHYMEEVQRLSDRAGILQKGKLVDVDTIPNLIKKYGGRVKVVVDARGAEVLRSYAQEVSVEGYRATGYFTEARSIGDALKELYSMGLYPEVFQPGMEDVFLSTMEEGDA